MRFTKINNTIANESAFAMEITTEGWGLTAAYVLGLALPGFGNAAVALFTAHQMDKILKDSKIKKYIVDCCEKLYKKACSDHKGQKIIKNLKDSSVFGRLIAGFKNTGGEHDDYGISAWKNLVFHKEINGLFIIALGDTDHIEQLDVVFFNESDNRALKYTIPAPSKKELQELGLRQED